MTPEPDLQTALDAVYAAFRDYSRPGTDAVCSEILRRKDARPPFGSSDEYVPYEAYSAWLAGPSVRERLECLASEIDDDEEAWRLRQALDGPMPPYPEVWRG